MRTHAKRVFFSSHNKHNTPKLGTEHDYPHYQQNWQKALDDLDRSIATEETPQALLLRGRVLACMRRWKPAVNDYDAVLERWPESSGEARAAREEALTPYVPLPMMSDEDAARLAAGE